MKRLVLCISLLGISALGAIAAQQSVKSLDAPAQPNFVFDDDGGAVQIVPAGVTAAQEKTFHGGAVMQSVRQVSIFLGSGWGDANVRSRETALSDLLAGGAASSELQQRRIQSLRAAPIQQDFSDLGNSAVTDLGIQHRLASMVRGKAVPAPGASTVFVVFLGPGVSSTLGSQKAGQDYAAYHNFFHIAAGEVRYVVVPFDANASTHQAAASRALVETALNPEGNGWF